MWYTSTWGEALGFIKFMIVQLRVFINTCNNNMQLSFKVGGVSYEVGIFNLLFTALVIAIVASVFVKGAKG